MSVVLHLASGAHLAAMAQAGGSGLASWAAEDGVATPGRDRWLRRMAWVGIALALGLQAVLLARHAAEVLEAPTSDVSLWYGVAVQTWVGRVLLAQLAGLVCAGMLLAAHAPLPWVGGAAALCLVASAFASHAGADRDPAWVVGANVLHVVAACLWFGALPCLLVAAGVGARARSNADPLGGALRRFSGLALPAMVVILLTGAALAYWLVGGQAGLFGTAYGATLLAKLGLVAAALLCAHRLRQMLGRRSRQGALPPGAGRVLGLEAGFGFGAVLLAGVLASLAPGAHADIVWPWPVRFAPWTAWQTVPGAAGEMAAAAGLLAGAVALACAFWRRGRRAAMGTACGVAAGAAAFGCWSASVEAYPVTYAHPTAPYDAAVISAGATTFHAHCAVCHGETGRGDGPGAAGLTPPPADLTAPHLGYHTHGDLYWWISHGMRGTAMPAFGAILDERQRWSVLQYLVAMSLGHQARVLGPAPVAEDPWLPAIGFAMQDGTSLSGLRGRAVEILFVNEAGAIPDAVARLNDGAADAALVLVLAAGLDAPPIPGVQTVADTDGTIWRAWSLYRRTLGQPGLGDRDAPPPMLGVLIDQFGFVRARWRSDDGRLPSQRALAEAVRALAREPELATVDDHGH